LTLNSYSSPLVTEAIFKEVKNAAANGGDHMELHIEPDHQATQHISIEGKKFTGELKWG